MIISINIILVTGLLSGSFSLASYKLYNYLENRKIEKDYEEIVKSYLNDCSDKFIIDYDMKLSNNFSPFRVIHFESISDIDLP